MSWESIVEGVLGKGDSDPPIHYPSADSGIATGDWVSNSSRHDGTISLPYIEPLSVKGKSIIEIKATDFQGLHIW